MKIDKNNPEQSWISLILRVAVGVLFALAAYGKFAGGLEKYAEMMMGMFKDTFLPGWMLRPYIFVLPFVESFLAIWLIVGCKLRYAWISATVVLLSLGFGLMIAKQNATDIYTYILIACVGLYMSKYDGGCCIGCCGPNKKK